MLLAETPSQNISTIRGFVERQHAPEEVWFVAGIPGFQSLLSVNSLSGLGSVFTSDSPALRGLRYYQLPPQQTTLNPVLTLNIYIHRDHLNSQAFHVILVVFPRIVLVGPHLVGGEAETQVFQGTHSQGVICPRDFPGL